MHTDRHHLTGSGWGMGWRRQGQVLGMLLGLLGCWQMGHAAEFTCPAGDEAAVACLIDAINAANANGEENTITLAAGSYTLQEVHNDTDGPNGLPSITSPLTLTGAGADATIIERQTSDPSGDTLAFCLLHVTATGRLTLTGVTLQGGGAELFESAGAGGGLRNSGGLVTLTNVTLAHNSTDHGGGGISNDGGTMTLTHVTLTDNDGLEGGGCIVNAARFGDGGIINRGTMTLTHVTLAHNSASDDAGGCIINGGTMTLTHVTLTGNAFAGGFSVPPQTAAAASSTVAP